MAGQDLYFVTSTFNVSGKNGSKRLPTRFQFIPPAAGFQTAKNDEAIRTIIRKQAMRGVAEKRRRKNAKSVVMEEDIPTGPVVSVLDLADMPVSCPSLKGYELVRARYGIDVATLSMLTTFHVGRATVYELSHNPLRLKHLLQHPGSSYFLHLPSRFDHAPFLGDVFECVVARIQQVLVPESAVQDTHVLSLYAKALKSTQIALDSQKSREEPELLCAISMLSLFELLDSSRASAWKHHASAAKSLVKYQGAAPRDNDFAKELLIAQTGPIITESIINNERCFLDGEAWQNLFESVVTEGVFHERSLSVISLRMLMAYLPAIMVDVGEAVCSAEKVDLSKLDALRTRVCRFRCKLLQWGRDFDYAVAPLTLPEAQQDLKTEVLGTYHVCVILINRMGICVHPEHSKELECDTVMQALELKRIVSAMSSNNPHTYLFGIQKMKIARFALVTTDDWQTPQQGVDGSGNSTGMLDPSVFRKWSNLLGRETP